MKRGITNKANKAGKMASTKAITPMPVPPVSAPETPAPPLAQPRPRSRVHPVWRALTALASLRLTVGLLALSLILVFTGTLAQIDAGIWSVVGQYFRSWYVWIPWQLFVKFGQIFFWLPKDWTVSGSFPFPAGYTIGFALLANLLAAHAVRFKLRWKRAGVIILHAGIILLMVGEFITGQMAVEGNMPIENQLSGNWVESRQKYELVFINKTDPATDVEIAIPASKLKPGAVIRHEALPFDVVVDQYYANCMLESVDDKLVAREKPVASGASTASLEDMPAAYITLKKKDSNETIRPSFMTSVWFTDWNHRRLFMEDPENPIITRSNRPRNTFMVGNDTFAAALRWQRTYKPYSITLEKFTHGLQPGTMEARDFSSQVFVTNTQAKDQRETTIEMNSPMRYRGETFYQSGVLGSDEGTILQVVRNPGWLLPYFACSLVSGGMLIHFGMYLNEYLKKRRAAA